MTEYRKSYVPCNIKQAIRKRYAWPGGYPLFLITEDNGILCCNCGKKEYKQIVWDYLHQASTGWRAIGVEINWEDPQLFCDNCNQRIESAYAEN